MDSVKSKNKTKIRRILAGADGINPPPVLRADNIENKSAMICCLAISEFFFLTGFVND